MAYLIVRQCRESDRQLTDEAASARLIFVLLWLGFGSADGEHEHQVLLQGVGAQTLGRAFYLGCMGDASADIATVLCAKRPSPERTYSHVPPGCGITSIHTLQALPSISEPSHKDCACSFARVTLMHTPFISFPAVLSWYLYQLAPITVIHTAPTTSLRTLHNVACVNEVGLRL